MTLLGLACEDNGHFVAITRLIDDALVRGVDWIVAETVAFCRTWCGYEAGAPWSKCGGDDDAPRSFEIDGRRVPLHGKINGQALEDGAAMWRRVLARFAQLDPRPELVVLAQDGDGRERERRRGVNQVRYAKSISWPFPIVVAMPEPEIEAWHVAGFEPCNDAEQAALANLRADLPFDPRTASHRLTSQPNDAVTDAKRVLARLCGGDADRVVACLADVDRLRERGGANGASAFLGEVDRDVVPLFAGRRP